MFNFMLFMFINKHLIYVHHRNLNKSFDFLFLHILLQIICMCVPYYMLKFYFLLELKRELTEEERITISSFTIITISIVGIILLVILIDFLCCVTNNMGIIALIFQRKSHVGATRLERWEISKFNLLPFQDIKWE